MDSNNLFSKDVFMGDAQLHTLLCAMWHYPYSLCNLSPIARQPPEAIITVINQRFDTEVQSIIHKMSEKKVVLSFPNHWEDVQAFRLADKGDTLFMNRMSSTKPSHQSMLDSK